MSKGVHGSDLRIAPADGRGVFRRDRPGFRQALGRDGAHDHALCPADPVAQGPRRGAGRGAQPAATSSRRPSPNTRSCDRRSTGTASGTSTWSPALPRTSRFPETFVDYSANPREYPLSTVQTVVRVHTRVSDLYNGPYDQLEEQMRLTIEGIKERQEWELVNSQKFGLLHSADPAMRISTALRRADAGRPGRAAGAGLEEAGLLPGASQGDRGFRARMHLAGSAAGDDQPVRAPVITWRGVPLVPCDKLEMKSRYQSNQWFGTTSILLLRVGEADQGVVGLHQAGIPGRDHAQPFGPADGPGQSGRGLLPADALFLLRRADRRRPGSPGERRSRLLPRLRTPGTAADSTTGWEFRGPSGSTICAKHLGPSAMVPVPFSTERQ